jgi:hypothetical protein
MPAAARAGIATLGATRLVADAEQMLLSAQEQLSIGDRDRCSTGLANGIRSNDLVLRAGLDYKRVAKSPLMRAVGMLGAR